ncbi:MAG: hypothetical protein ABW360_11455 [Phenylobacterium sp.]
MGALASLMLAAVFWSAAPAAGVSGFDPSTCVKGVDLARVRGADSALLWQWYRHFQLCTRDSEGIRVTLAELVRRGDGDAEVEYAVAVPCPTLEEQARARALLESARRKGAARAGAWIASTRENGLNCRPSVN